MNPNISPFQPVHSPIAIGVRDVLARIGFNPATLFDTGKVGWVYDLNDFSTMFQDAAGTIPAAVNQPVGLVLDKSKRLALGSEIIPDTGFNDASKWTAGAGWSVTGGKALFAGGTDANISSTAAVAPNKFYRVVVTVDSISNGTFRVFVGTSAAPDISITSPGTYSFVALAEPTGTQIFLRASSNTSGIVVDSLSVTELQGNHKYQTTSTSRSILRGTPKGANLVTNGGFASSTGWARNGGTVSITGGQAVFTNSTAGHNAQWIGNGGVSGLVIGRVYRVTYTIASISSGALRSFAGAGGITRISPGTYVDYITAAGTSLYIGVVGGTATNATVDNVEVFDVSADAVQAPYGLQKDGADDFELTAPVDLTGTDKFAVCIGVRKLSDAAGGMLVELSANGSANAGSFAIEAPGNLAAEYRVSLWGAGSVGQYTCTPYASPVTNVLSVVYDIGGAVVADEIKPRVNGAVPTLTSTGNANSGTGNFGNYSFYFGRRGGASLPANVIEFSSIGYGGLPDATQLASMERWTTARTPLAA